MLLLETIQKLHLMQNAATRVVNGARYLAQVTLSCMSCTDYWCISGAIKGACSYILKPYMAWDQGTWGITFFKSLYLSKSGEQNGHAADLVSQRVLVVKD